MSKRRPKLPKKHVFTVLEHVMRLTIATPESTRIECFPEQTVDKTRQLLEAMKIQQLLAKQELFGPEAPCFHFGKRGAMRLGLSPQAATHLGTEALIRSFGVLAFMCLSPSAGHRSKLTQKEFLKHYPPPQGITRGRPPASSYYVTTEHGSPRLGFVRVDIGGSYRNIIKNAERDVKKRFDLEELKDVFQDEALEMAIVTSTPEKKMQMDSLAQERQFPIPLVVESHHQLLYLYGERIQKQAAGNGRKNTRAEQPTK